jgi:dinuclear metal center YbgI/SA1388 family protein
MNKYEIIRKIENFAPVESAEAWDCVGFMVETNRENVYRIMICLTVTEAVVAQARRQECDMIISHHPLFEVPVAWSDIDIYSAHTNLDKAKGGTTDTIIDCLYLDDYKVEFEHEFLRMIDFRKDVLIDEFIEMFRGLAPNVRYINNKRVESVRKVAFCAGSGSEFISEAKALGVDALVTGDLKFHTALDSDIVVVDMGHFESEIATKEIFFSILSKKIPTFVVHLSENDKSPIYCF